MNSRPKLPIHFVFLLEILSWKKFQLSLGAWQSPYDFFFFFWINFAALEANELGFQLEESNYLFEIVLILIYVFGLCKTVFIIFLKHHPRIILFFILVKEINLNRAIFISVFLNIHIMFIIPFTEGLLLVLPTTRHQKWLMRYLLKCSQQMWVQWYCWLNYKKKKKSGKKERKNVSPTR